MCILDKWNQHRGAHESQAHANANDCNLGRTNPHYTIIYYSSVSGELRETKSSILVQGGICYRGYGSVKSTVLFIDF